MRLCVRQTRSPTPLTSLPVLSVLAGREGHGWQKTFRGKSEVFLLKPKQCSHQKNVAMTMPTSKKSRKVMRRASRRAVKALYFHTTDQAIADTKSRP